jgi:hypothetical protein
MVFLAESCEGTQEIEKNTHDTWLCVYVHVCVCVCVCVWGGGDMWSEIALPSSTWHHIKVKPKANNKY